jgi:hypothetical protein
MVEREGGGSTLGVGEWAHRATLLERGWEGPEEMTLKVVQATVMAVVEVMGTWESETGMKKQMHL